MYVFFVCVLQIVAIGQLLISLIWPQYVHKTSLLLYCHLCTHTMPVHIQRTLRLARHTSTQALYRQLLNICSHTYVRRLFIPTIDNRTSYFTKFKIHKNKHIYDILMYIIAISYRPNAYL